MSENIHCAICNSATSDDMRGGRCNAWSMCELEGIFMIECGLMICNLCWNTRGTYCNKCKDSNKETRKNKVKQKRVNNSKTI